MDAELDFFESEQWTTQGKLPTSWANLTFHNRNNINTKQSFYII